MWSLGHTFREVERSHSRAAFEETATTGAVWIFAVASLIVLIVFRSTPGWTVALGFGCVALYASIHSTFIADRDRGALILQRRIAFWNIEKEYDVKTIDRVYVVSTQKGSGLAMRFISGRKKTLTISLGFDHANLDAAAMALNAFVHAHRGK